MHRAPILGLGPAINLDDACCCFGSSLAFWTVTGPVVYNVVDYCDKRVFHMNPK